MRWIEIAGATYGFDCAPEDITNFMAAYTPLMVNQDGETGYKVWLDKDKKGLVMLNYASMKKRMILFAVANWPLMFGMKI